MSLPIRSLPVVQNWDCRGCGTCCHEYEVRVSDEERRRIAAQGWERENEFTSIPLFLRAGPPWAAQYRLNHRADGSCVFLDNLGHCRIHDRFGASAKPFACQLYPFILIPAGNHWRVGLRFSCPSVAGSKGRPLASHHKGIRDYAHELERTIGPAVNQPPPRLIRGQRASWDDLLRIVQSIGALLKDDAHPFERRMRRVLGLVRLCRQARFDRLQGIRLTEFLTILSASLADSVPTSPEDVPAPSWIGRVLFRQSAGVYARRDRGPSRGVVVGRLGLLRAGWHFARGRGAIPRVHAWLADRTFAHGEEPGGPLPPEVDRLLERYYLTKVLSLQFCGAACYGLPVWEGIEALTLTYPIILWLGRLLQAETKLEALTRAVSVVDHNYGYNQLLGSPRQRWNVRLLARRGELEKLVSWYSR